MKKYSFVLMLVLAFFSSTPIHAQVDDTHYIVFSVKDDRMVDGLGVDERMYPASLTKVMSAMVAFNHIENLDQEVIISAQALASLEEENASVVGFQEGEHATYRDLLYGTLLSSGADATNQLAISLFGSQQAMVDEMNAQSVLMHLTDTNFTNVSGLHNPYHYSTLIDMVTIMNKALGMDELKQIMETNRYTSSNGKHTMVHTVLKNQSEAQTNTILGGKSGYTPQAGTCLLSFEEIQGELFISAVSAISFEYEPMVALSYIQTLNATIDHNYSRQVILKQGSMLAELPLEDATQDIFEAKTMEDVTLFVSNNLNAEDVVVNFRSLGPYVAPLNAGSLVGYYDIMYHNTKVGTYTYYVDETIPQDLVKVIRNKIVNHWYIVVAIVLVLSVSYTRWIKGRKHKKSVYKKVW